MKFELIKDDGHSDTVKRFKLIQSDTGLKLIFVDNNGVDWSILKLSPLYAIRLYKSVPTSAGITLDTNHGNCPLIIHE